MNSKNYRHEHKQRKRTSNTAQSEPLSGSKENYTRPMHPEIQQKGARNYPICGMALAPATVSIDNKEKLEPFVHVSQL